MRRNKRQCAMIAAQLLIWTTYTAQTSGLCLTPGNFPNLILLMVIIGILTGLMLLVMVACHIDLSMGSVCCPLGAIGAYLMSEAGVHPVFVIHITVACGLVAEAWHGFWAAYQGVQAFIATLPSQITFRGFTLAVTIGSTIGSTIGELQEYSIKGMILLLAVWVDITKKKSSA